MRFCNQCGSRLDEESRKVRPRFLSTRLEHGDWLAAQGRAEEAEPLLVEAREAFERLEATALARARWAPSDVVAQPEPVS
jgi:hypothetical protein